MERGRRLGYGRYAVGTNIIEDSFRSLHRNIRRNKAMRESRWRVMSKYGLSLGNYETLRDAVNNIKQWANNE
jgi:hypothetical protein